MSRTRGGTVRRVTTRARPSARLFEACSPFGVMVDHERGGRPTPQAIEQADERLLGMGPGMVGLMTGPSGCGKSRAMDAIEARLRRRGAGIVRVDPGRLVDEPASVVDLLPGSVAGALSVLARAGLAEATLLPRRACELSEGERSRLAIALAMHRAAVLTGRGIEVWVLGDELCSVLDRATAEAVAATVRRWVSESPVRLIAATAHEDMVGFLQADVVRRWGTTTSDSDTDSRGDGGRSVIRIEPGHVTDYDGLSHLHYVAGRPATIATVLRAVRRLPTGVERVAGVLVVSHPTLNGAWRKQAWPGRFSGGNKREQTKRINADLRCISRVVVEPSSRGLGVARRLVEAYLASPLTPATEAVAAMGAVCPFFERGGMTAYRLGQPEACSRLLDALDAAGVGAWSVLDGERAERAAAQPLLARELDRWVRVKGATRLMEGCSPGDRLRIAVSRSSAPPMAYAHTTG